jgi:hypothetical protein
MSAIEAKWRSKEYYSAGGMFPLFSIPALGFRKGFQNYLLFSEKQAEIYI